MQTGDVESQRGWRFLEMGFTTEERMSHFEGAISIAYGKKFDSFSERLGLELDIFCSIEIFPLSLV